MVDRPNETVSIEEFQDAVDRRILLDAKLEEAKVRRHAEIQAEVEIEKARKLAEIQSRDTVEKIRWNGPDVEWAAWIAEAHRNGYIKAEGLQAALRLAKQHFCKQTGKPFGHERSLQQNLNRKNTGGRAVPESKTKK